MPTEEEIQKAKATIEAAAAPKLPPKPRQLDIDAYDQLFMDNILWRERAARSAIELANKELADAATMKSDLVKKLRQKFSVEADWQITIDQVRKTAVAEKK